MTEVQHGAVSPAVGGWRRTLEWIERHDESVVFVVLYIALAVGLSIFVSLFWLVAVVAVHLGLEVVRQARRPDIQGVGNVAIEALWEIKLDLALVAAALALGVYLEAIFGILGLHSAGQAAHAARAGVRVGTRAPAWTQAIRGVLIAVDDLLHAVKFLKLRKNKEKGEAKPERPPSSPLRPSGWSKGDWAVLTFLGVGVLLLLVAAPLLGLSVVGVLEALGEELRPFPGR